MKKNSFAVTVCVVALLLTGIVGCVTADGSKILRTQFQDLSKPWQEQALILPSGGSPSIPYIVSVDGITPGIGTNKVGIIPAGTHTIIVSVSDVGVQQAVKADPITYEFQPGGRYVVAGIMGSSPGFGFGRTTAKIYTVEEYRTEYFRMKPKFNESDFQDWVLVRFDNAAAELNKRAELNESNATEQ